MSRDLRREEVANYFRRLAKSETLYGEGASLMAKGSTADASKEAAAHGPEIEAAEGTFTYVVNLAFRKNWNPKPKTDLARAANVSTKMIDRLLDGSATKLTKEASRVCEALGINPDAAAKGEYVQMGAASDRELHEQLDALLKSEHGSAVRIQIESLYLSIARNNAGKR